MTPVVIDASAGVELVADTDRGRALRALLPADAVPWVRETFFVEVGSVLRRWDRNAILTPDQIKDAIRQLAAWPLRVAQVRAHFADASYVSLAEHLGAELLTDDHELANAPTLTVGCCDCRSPRELPAARSQLEDDPGAQRTKAPRLISAVAQRYV